MTKPDPFNHVWREAFAIGGVKAYGSDLSRFGFIMNVAWEVTDYGIDFRRSEAAHVGMTELIGNGQVVHHARLDDVEEQDDFDRQIPEIMRAVGLVEVARKAGQAVLVTCAAGRNRSALIVAEYLIQAGENADTVIRSIQANRPLALTNETFVAWLRRTRS